MYKRNSKLTKVEINHNLEREIYYGFKRFGSVSTDYYEDRFTLDEMLQIIFETILNYESSTGVLNKKYGKK